MARTRLRRVEPTPAPDQVVLRGLLGAAGLDSAELRQAAGLNHDLYGFYGVSVWLADGAHPAETLERTKLVKFDRYVQFVVADLTARELELWATGMSPHYDVVHGQDDLDRLVEELRAAPHQVRLNPQVDREEH
ncbi:MAG: hypothetical protein ACYDAQ_09910 [Mycobacteriales bacterium]